MWMYVHVHFQNSFLIFETFSRISTQVIKLHSGVVYATSNALESLPAKTAFSFPCPPTAGKLSALTAGLGGWGGAAALRIPCESHRITGARAPVWYLHQPTGISKATGFQHLDTGKQACEHEHLKNAIST